MVKNARFCLVITLVIVFFVSCGGGTGVSSDDERGGPKPWDGQKINEMGLANDDDTIYIPQGANVYQFTAGETLWFSINAKADMTYTVVLKQSVLIQLSVAPFMRQLTRAEVKITGYKEDGTLFAKRDTENELEGFRFPYFSPYDQKLYVYVEYLTTGATCFYYKETDFYFED